MNKREPSLSITFGKIFDPETISAVLHRHGLSFGDYVMIKVNGKPVHRTDKMIYGGDVIMLFKNANWVK
jgi:hypothetical protein